MTVAEQLQALFDDESDEVRDQLFKTIWSGAWMAEMMRNEAFDVESAIAFAQDFLGYVGMNARGYDT